MLDVLIGLGMVTAMLGALGMTLAHHHRTTAALTAQRRAVARAEAALTRLQGGDALKLDPAKLDLTVLPTTPPRKGWVWLKVQARAKEQSQRAHASLVGVAPRSAVQENTP